MEKLVVRPFDGRRWGAMMTMALIGFASLALQMSLAAGTPGLWVGSRVRDPKTDKWNSLAFIYDNDGQGAIGLFCNSGKPDLMITTEHDTFTVGSRMIVTYRLDDAPPKDIPGIATEPAVLLLDYRQSDVLVPILRTKKIAVRFSGQLGREITMVFAPALPPNTLHLVGQVLSDCNLAPYPAEELKKAERALEQKRR